MTVPTNETDHPQSADEVRDLATRGTPLAGRIEGLQQAVQAARGRLDDELLDEVSRTVDRAVGRLRLSAQHTVVAIGGATGSGKSSTYNHLVGLELSSIGVRRPTTSWATAVVWGREGAEELLEWLGIPPRHQTMRDSLLDARREDNALDGVVLMDLPDHDSTEVAHHLEVDRLVELADLLVWVVDPQKYADAALHDRYLKPLAGHQGVMVVVLNHIDTIAEDKREAMIADVRRLLAEDGLDRVTVLPVSAKHGLGMDALRAEIAGRVATKQATVARLEADLSAAAARLEQAGGGSRPREVAGSVVEDLHAKIADAAGVPVVADAVGRSVAARARRAVAWPPAALLGRSARGELAAELAEAEGVRLRDDAVPQVAPVDRPALRTAVRECADDVGRDLGPAWTGGLRSVAGDRLEETGHLLDRRLRGIDLRATRVPAWVSLVRVLQWLLLAAAVGGGVWWLLSATGAVAEAPRAAGVPVPAWVALGGLAAGLVVWLLARLALAGVARNRAAQVEDELRAVVVDVVDTEVVEPLRTAAKDYRDFHDGVSAAR